MEKRSNKRPPRRDGKTDRSRRDNDRRDRFKEELPANIVVGRNAVTELLRSGAPIDKILVASREGYAQVIIAEAKKAGVTVVDSNNESLGRLSRGENHQGVIAMVAEKEYSTIDDILALAEEKGEKPLILICDGIEDPHNLGAVIRCAECAGAHGVIIPERRACGLTPAVSKASAGAIAYVHVAKVKNIAECVEQLKERGIWTYAAEAGGVDFYECDWDRPCAIVMGGEDSGVSRLVKERCDYIVSIPMFGRVNSLNVSTATSVLLCHAARMQKLKK